MPVEKRYIVADSDAASGMGWTHIFDEDGEDRERQVRFVYDRLKECVIAAGVKVDRSWIEGDRSVVEELTSSLNDANPEAIEDPEGWSLMIADDVPAWAATSRDPAP